MGFLNFTALCIFGEGYPGARSAARIVELRGWAGDSLGLRISYFSIAGSQSLRPKVPKISRCHARRSIEEMVHLEKL